MANFFTNLFSAGASSLVEAVGDAIDKNSTSKEELKELEAELAKASMKYDLEMASMDVEVTKAHLQDSASAREHQSRVQESQHASWLAKNVHPMLAVSIIGLTFFMFFWIVVLGNINNFTENGTEEIVIYILGALTTIATQVAAYYFGSSQGSADKQKAIDSYTKKHIS